MFQAHEAYDWFQRMEQAMPEQLVIEGREFPVTRKEVLRVFENELRPMLTHGPTYDRTVDDHAGRALVSFLELSAGAFVHWMREACEAAAVARQAEDFGHITEYVTATSWGVSYSTGSDIEGVKLNVCDVVVGRTFLAVSHPVHDGKVFATRDEASAYALRMGLLKRYVPTRNLV